MANKYSVPALEKANAILHVIAEEPSVCRLIDLSNRLEINKSSMFSLLSTMETMEWVVREKNGTYSLGSKLGYLGNVFFKQFSLIDLFRKEASVTKLKIKETIQLAKLERNEVLYLAKEESPSRVKLKSEPGMKLPAHATALGKVMLAALDSGSLDTFYPEGHISPILTPYTISEKSKLLDQLKEIKRNGYAVDVQESVLGFFCVAAPLLDSQGSVIAAISCSMYQNDWESKRELVQEEICTLGQRLSHGTK